MPGRSDRKPLTRDRVVTAALRQVDRHGLEALSMRRLGAALRVEAMSLYKHVPHKAALVDLVIERVLRDVAAPSPGATWQERLRHVAGELRRVALAHPHVFPVLATRVPSSPQALAPLEAMLAGLHDAGLDDDATLRHFWAFIAYVTGALLAETAALTGAGDATIEVPPTLDAAAFPHLGRLAERIGTCDFAREYQDGLDIMIAAVASEAGATKRASIPVARRATKPRSGDAGMSSRTARTSARSTRGSR